MKFHKMFLQFVLSLALLISIPAIELAAASPGILTGLVQYQGRQEHEGIIIRLPDDETLAAVTNSQGYFTLDGLDEGTYLVRVEAQLYLADRVKVTAARGKTLTASPITLFGGDLNNDDKIDIADATLVGFNFGQPAANADVNADGQVNIQDLAIIGGNFGKVTPEPLAGNVHLFYLPIVVK